MSKQGDFDAFLRATKAHRKASAEDAARVAIEIGPQIDWDRPLPSAMNDALDADLANAAARPAAGKTSAGWRNWKVALGAASAVIIGVAAYKAGMSSSDHGQGMPAPSAVGLPAPTANPNPVIETKPSEPPAPPVLVLADPSLLPTAPKVVRGAPSSSAPANGSLDAELAMLAETSAALRKHDPSKALALVAEHGVRFPNGVLGPEFTAQRILALSALGRKSEACSEATKFIAANESSPLLPQVRAACVGIHP